MTPNARLICLESAALHQALAGIWSSDSDAAEIERLNALDAFGDADRLARVRRENGEPWARGVLDC